MTMRFSRSTAIIVAQPYSFNNSEGARKEEDEPMKRSKVPINQAAVGAMDRLQLRMNH